MCRSRKVPAVSSEFFFFLIFYWAPRVARVVKNLPDNAGDLSDAGSIRGWGGSPGGGHGNPLQYSCLENPVDKGACRATVHGVTKNGTRLKLLRVHGLISEYWWGCRRGQAGKLLGEIRWLLDC